MSSKSSRSRSFFPPWHSSNKFGSAHLAYSKSLYRHYNSLFFRVLFLVQWCAAVYEIIDILTDKCIDVRLLLFDCVVLIFSTIYIMTTILRGKWVVRRINEWFEVRMRKGFSKRIYDMFSDVYFWPPVVVYLQIVFAIVSRLLRT